MDPRGAAATLLQLMRQVTPPGAARPWRSQRNLEAIAQAIRDGADPAELREFIAGAAELVKRGGESREWWYPVNLFTGTSGDRWQQKVAAMLEADRLAEARREAERQAELQRAAEAELQPARPAVEDLGFRRVLADASAAWQKRWDAQKRDEEPDERSG